MERTVQITADGSQTLVIPGLDITYHSRRGALGESLHVFIKSGLQYILEAGHTGPLNVFEMGFGTGLNALLTLQEAERLRLPVIYQAIDTRPLREDEWRLLNYGAGDDAGWFEQLHNCPWGEAKQVSEFFSLEKSQVSLEKFQPGRKFELVYYDAFAPSAQPDLWTAAVFKHVHSMMTAGGVLVTYCCKGVVRRAMLAAGFNVEKIKGPPGKKHMLRAFATGQ